MKSVAVSSESTTSIDDDLWAAHRRLANFNHHRLDPSLPSNDWRTRLDNESRSRHLEGEILEWERSLVGDRAITAPTMVDEFMTWFEGLRETGPGQNSALFPWLAHSATREQMKWFIGQEVSGVAGFEDLCAMTQIKTIDCDRATYGPTLEWFAENFEFEPIDLEDRVPESIATANIMLGLAVNRRYAFHSIGALGAVELTAGERTEMIEMGLKRVGLDVEARSNGTPPPDRDWARDVVRPLVTERPGVARAIAEGALMRLNAGARCLQRYAREFNVALH